MGIQINGATDSITAIDGTIDVVSAIGNAGVVTATAFVGNITGNVTGNINHASNLELQVGGVTRANINSSGQLTATGKVFIENNLGIRNTTASAPLHVKAPDTGGGNIAYFDDTGSGTTARLMVLTTDGVASGGIKFQTVNKRYTYFGNATNKITIDNNNSKIGINTDAPSKELHVDGTIFASGNTASLNGGLRIQPNNSGTNYGGVIYGGAHNDNNTAIYMRRGADGGNNTIDINSYGMFRVFTNGALASQDERLRIRNDGYIGINTTSPSKLVTIKADAPFVRLEAADPSDKRLDLQVSSSGIATISAEQSSQQLSFKTTGGEALRITSGGNVGINSTSPAARLDVFKDYNGLGAGNPAARIYGIDAGVAETGIRFVEKGTGDLHNTSDAYLMRGISNGNNRFVFKGNGNVGIGEDDPDDLLSIKKSSSTAYDATATQSGGARLSIFNSNNTLSNTFADIHFKCHSTSSAEARIGMRLPSINNSELFFITENNNNLVERLRIASDGKVHIGDAIASSGTGALNIKTSSAGTYFKFRSASDFDSNLEGTALDSRNSANNASKDLVVRSQTLVFWQGSNEKLRFTHLGQIGISGANYGTSGQVLTSTGSSSGVSWATPVVLAMGYSSDGSDSNTTVNNNTQYAGSTLTMTRVSATSKYILRIGAQIYRPATSGRGYLRYRVKVNSGSYNNTPGDSSRYRWYAGDETHENYKEITLTYLSSGSVGDTVTFQVGYENTSAHDDRFRWQIIQATEVSALTVS